MSEWPRGSLGDVLSEADDRNTDGTIELVLSVTEGRGIVPQTEVFKKRIATNDTAAYKVVEPLDIAWNPYLLWTGAVGQWLGSESGVTSPVYPIFRARKDQDARFWGLVLESGLLTPYFDSTAMGSIQRRRRTTVPVFKAAAVRIPSLTQQRRIVDVMAAVDAQIETLAEEFERQLLLRVRLFLDSHDRHDIAVEQIAVVSQGKALPKSVQTKRTGEISWFKIADMTGPGNEDGYTLADTRLALSHVHALKGAVVPAGSVVFPRVGAAVLTEKKRILEIGAAVDENHLVLTPKGGISPECMLAAIESIRLADLVQTGAVPSLNMGLIRRAQIPWSAEANARMDDTLSAMRAHTRVLRAELDRLRTFRSALLTSVLTQEIEIPESYDDLLQKVS